jgi:hypothetical protein
MNYLIGVEGGGDFGKAKLGWISRWGYTTARNRESARRFETADAAKSFALVLAAKCPHYIGKLRVVYWPRSI